MASVCIGSQSTISTGPLVARRSLTRLPASLGMFEKCGTPWRLGASARFWMLKSRTS